MTRYLALRGLTADAVRAYTTRKGSHLRVWLRSTRVHGVLSAETICSLQEQLGDDPFRVAFNRARIAREQTGWNVLFTQKYRNGRLVSCETFDREMTEKFRAWFGMD